MSRSMPSAATRYKRERAERNRQLVIQMLIEGLELRVTTRTAMPVGDCPGEVHHGLARTLVRQRKAVYAHVGTPFSGYWYTTIRKAPDGP